MDATLPKTSRPKRKSIAHQPSSVSARRALDNATTDIAALKRAETSQATKKKLRGKSLGPGGIEALRETTGNATKAEHAMQLRSILKPTVPLTPPKVIPSFDELRQRSTKKRSPAKSGAEELLIDFSTPAPSRQNVGEAIVSGAENVMDPFSPTKMQPTAQTEEEESQELEKRQAEKQAILDRRAERRKSMANRRVSFAPEATLHTWSVMELGEDSTTSSASTRRQSSMTTQETPRQPTSASSPASERPKTPPEQSDEPQVVASPAHQRDLHQRKRRRSSTGPSAQLEGSLDEVFSSSPSGDIQTDSSPVRIDDSVESDSDDDTDGDTAMSMAESTSQSLGSEDSTASHTSLDERLRQAASQAGTRGIEYDENGEDLSMEMAEDTVTNAFKPWAQQQIASRSDPQEDQENIVPSASASVPNDSEEDEETQDMSMDVTNALGGILAIVPAADPKRRKSVANTRRRSSVASRRSSGGGSADGDESMDFTAVNGGILSYGRPLEDGDASDEDMTMEFTSDVGSGIAQANYSADDDTADATDLMDITSAFGGILPPIEEQTEPQTDVEDNQTMAMEMTRAIGGIITSQPANDDETAQMEFTQAVGGILPRRITPEKTQAKQLMQEETNAGQLNLSPAALLAPPTPKSSGPVTSIASETGSPDITLKPRLSGRSRQATTGPSTTPKFSPRRPSPAKSSPMKGTRSTPTKQLAPLPSRSEKPNRTPVNVNIAQRSASPKRLFKDELKARESPGSVQKPSAQKSGLFSQGKTAKHMPNVVLNAQRPQPPRRRSSGIGIDQQGYGSPQVTKILERRSSIGDAAPVFKLHGAAKSKLRFEDPVEIEREIDAERAEEERRESGRFIMEQEANMQQEENATLHLSQMIESMTPKKEKSSRLKGRKSLAVGGARGLLGKRPAELDSDDEGSPNSPKRLKWMEREGSPVKKVHLPKPPTKEETTGRLTRAEQRQLQELTFTGSTTPAASPPKKSARSPHGSGRYRDIPVSDSAARPESFVDKLDNVVGAVDVSVEHPKEAEHDRISLQEFLSMTNIHFIELSTTKRRHTMVPAPQRPSQEQADKSREAQFAAAATTLPLLELYQHATRELKTYISTGRKIIRSIEAETLNDQPQLFKEYVDARPDVKAVMDNQFRNGKTNARLQSKETWYTWRSQLVDGLRSGLEGIKRGMQRDVAQLNEQQSGLDAVVPGLTGQRTALDWELASLKQSLEELESLDTDALDEARRQLRTADQENERKAALLETLRQQMADKEETLTSAEELKNEMNAQIDEAERVREEYRGWPVADVLELKDKVDSIEKSTGWHLITAEEDDDEDQNGFGVALTLSYKNEVRLFFYPAAFQKASNNRRRSGRKSKSVSGPSAPLSLTYAPVDEFGDVLAKEISTEKRFFMQLIRSQLHSFNMMPKGSVAPKVLLDTISRGWELANLISEEVRLLKMTGVTSTQIQGDETLSVRTKLVLHQQSRIDVEFTLSVAPLSDGGISSSTSVSAKGIYGVTASLLQGSRGRKVEAALNKEVEGRQLGQGAFIGAVHAFEQWLASQADKKAEKGPAQQAQAAAPKDESVSEEAEPQQDTAPQTRLPKGPELDAIPPVTNKELRRSPLAPKTANIPAKPTVKKLPVPSKRFTLANKAQLPAVVPEPEKENATVIVHKQVQQAQTPTKQLQLETEMYANAEDIDAVSPAIPPEMQDQMIAGSPFKRRGALRRSPM